MRREEELDPDLDCMRVLVAWSGCQDSRHSRTKGLRKGNGEGTVPCALRRGCHVQRLRRLAHTMAAGQICGRAPQRSRDPLAAWATPPPALELTSRQVEIRWRGGWGKSAHRLRLLFACKQRTRLWGSSARVRHACRKDTKLDIQSRTFAVEPEITAKIGRMHLRVYEVSISYSGRDYSEGKKIGLKDAFIAVWAIVRWSLFG